SDGAIIVGFIVIDAAATVVGVCNFGINADGLIVIGQRTVMVAFAAPDVAAIEVEIRTLWIETDGLVVSGHGTIKIPFCGLDAAFHAPGYGSGTHRVVRIKRDRLIAVRQGTVIVLLGVPDIASVHVESDAVWIETDRLVIIRDCAVKSA